MAHLAAALLGDDAARSERRDAGTKALFRLASLAGRAQQQSPSALAAAAEEALVAADVARDGASETLRRAIALASASSSAVPSAKPCLSAAGTCSSGSGSDSSSGGGRDGEGERAGGPGRGPGGGVGSGDGRAVQDWVLQTLAPLLQHPSGREKRVKAAPGTTPIVLPETRRKPRAEDLEKSPAEVRAIELSAALGVADALLLQAARSTTPPADEPNRRGQGREGPQPLLARLLLETPLAAGLLALACSGCAPPVRAGAAETPQSSRGAAARSRIPPSRRHRRRQQQQNGGGDEAEGTNAPQAAALTADERAVAAATAEAALAIAREGAAVCPEGLWVGLRAELLPALAAGSGSASGVGGVGGGVPCFDGGDGGGGVASDVRTGLVLKEVVAGMGTRVVPFAARLLPVALRGMTDAREEVRWACEPSRPLLVAVVFSRCRFFGGVRGSLCRATTG